MDIIELFYLSRAEAAQLGFGWSVRREASSGLGVEEDSQSRPRIGWFENEHICLQNVKGKPPEGFSFPESGNKNPSASTFAQQTGAGAEALELSIFVIPLKSLLYVYERYTWLGETQRYPLQADKGATTGDRRTMKSVLGAVLAVVVALAFALAWRLATRDEASFLDQQWLFLVAFPYNWGLVQIFGGSSFSADAPAQLLAAASSEAGLAYGAGAGIEAVARALWRGLRRLRAPA